jgi:DNA repair exonuclease SbcCD ATPase subunit
VATINPEANRDSQTPRPQTPALPIINFKRDEWHTREKLAELLGISVRTLYRRIDDGDIEVKDSAEGKRYRLAPEQSGREDATDDSVVPDDKTDTSGKSVANELLGLIREQLDQIKDLQTNHGRLEAKLEASQNDVGRAVDYVADLEAEHDRLAEERAELADALQHERGRREQLQNEREQLRAELAVLTGMRAKFHLERGRREQAEHRRDELRDELETLRRELDELARQLDDEQQRRLRLALGSLSVEVRRQPQSGSE